MNHLSILFDLFRFLSILIDSVIILPHPLNFHELKIDRNRSKSIDIHRFISISIDYHRFSYYPSLIHLTSMNSKSIGIDRNRSTLIDSFDFYRFLSILLLSFPIHSTSMNSKSIGIDRNRSTFIDFFRFLSISSLKYVDESKT